MADAADGSQAGLTKGARITGDQRSSLGTSFGERYAAGESIRSIAQDTGRSYGFVHGVLKESGASLRGRGGATRGPRRGPAVKLDDQAAAGADQGTASPVRTKAKAAKAKSVKDLKDVKDVKDDKGKKKAEPKKDVEGKKNVKKGKK